MKSGAGAGVGLGWGWDKVGAGLGQDPVSVEEHLPGSSRPWLLWLFRVNAHATCIDAHACAGALTCGACVNQGVDMKISIISAPSLLRSGLSLNLEAAVWGSLAGWRAGVGWPLPSSALE